MIDPNMKVSIVFWLFMVWDGLILAALILFLIHIKKLVKSIEIISENLKEIKIFLKKEN